MVIFDWLVPKHFFKAKPLLGKTPVDEGCLGLGVFQAPTRHFVGLWKNIKAQACVVSKNNNICRSKHTCGRYFLGQVRQTHPFGLIVSRVTGDQLVVASHCFLLCSRWSLSAFGYRKSVLQIDSQSKYCIQEFREFREPGGLLVVSD